MRPFDEIPFEEADYSDVALLVASVREWPTEDFARELDSRVEQRFAPVAAPAADRRSRRGRLSRWTAGPAVALVAAAVAGVVVLTGGSGNGPVQQEKPIVNFGASQLATTAHRPASNQPTVTAGGGVGAERKAAPTLTSATGLSTNSSSSNPQNQSIESGPAVGAPSSAGTTYGALNATSSAPVAPGGKQIRSAQISLTTPNQHVNQVASEVFGVVSLEHGTVQSSHITSATTSSGGGYAWFSLTIPTGNLQDTITQLSRLHYAALQSSSAGSQNVSNQYNSDQRQLSDARALRASLLKQLQTAYTQQAIDSIRAQLKLAEQQINTWQATLSSLNHRISYSNLTVQINAGGLPVPLAHRHVASGGFTIGRAGHDALRVLVVSAGVALIALAVALPVGLVAALLVWLWVWLRQRRREHALDAAA